MFTRGIDSTGERSLNINLSNICQNKSTLSICQNRPTLNICVLYKQKHLQKRFRGTFVLKKQKRLTKRFDQQVIVFACGL